MTPTVLTRLPENVLSRFEVTVVDGEFHFRIELRREPEPGELEHFERVIEHALAEFRQRMGSRQ